MKIVLLGYGLEGKSTEKYFKSHFDNVEIDIFDGETPEQFRKRDYSGYDYVFRSPSIPPLHLKNESSITKYFFNHCPCPIIGVTATKGKGTICSFIKALLDAEHLDAHLVGNIGVPALDALDELQSTSVVVYELSSFQLWDLDKSPHIAVVGTIEPDHLNIHRDFDDYLNAKTNICRHQTADDYLIYYNNNPDSLKIAASVTLAHKIAYPFELPEDIKAAITLPGIHNQENATAAIAAVACLLNISPDAYLSEHKSEIIKGLKSFHGLPHRLEFLRELNGVKYYDDNFATNLGSTEVAISAFPDDAIVLILGGRDKTSNEDLPALHDFLYSIDHITKIILIGESGHELQKRYTYDPRYLLAESLEEAVALARKYAESNIIDSHKESSIVLMSPAAASFDMFDNVYDRGTKFQSLVNSLK